MAINSLNLINTESGKIELETKYDKVIDSIMANTISQQFKNKDLSGDPTSGAVYAKRFANATSAEYGTARTANKASAVKAKPVLVPVDKHKEILEEVEEFDARMLGVDGLIDRRINNHKKALGLLLEKEYITLAEAKATDVVLTSFTTLKDKVDAVIAKLKAVKNDFVDGVEAEDIIVTLNSKTYGAFQGELEKLASYNADTGKKEFGNYHGVQIKENTRQTVDILAMRVESIAQPVHITVCNQGKLQLSNAYGFGLFIDYGTKEVTPDLIFKGTVA